MYSTKEFKKQIARWQKFPVPINRLIQASISRIKVGYADLIYSYLSDKHEA